MTKQDYAMRLTFLGITGRQLATMMECSSTKLSDAITGASGIPSAIAVKNRADEMTMRLVNEKRQEMMPAIEEQVRAAGIDGEIEAIMPVYNRVTVVSDGKIIGYFDVGARSFRRV